jgi:hypothetical protein
MVSQKTDAVPSQVASSPQSLIALCKMTLSTLLTPWSPYGQPLTLGNNWENPSLVKKNGTLELLSEAALTQTALAPASEQTGFQQGSCAFQVASRFYRETKVKDHTGMDVT